MDTQILEDLGLTGSEIKVFVNLLELGSSAAGPIVEKSGVQNAVVHRTLHSLIEKGLATYVLEGKKKIYQAVNPKGLLDYIEEKKERLEKIMPELLARKNSAEKKPTATTFQGIRGVKELLLELLETESNQYMSYGGADISNKLLGEFFWESFHRRRVKQKIEAKLLFHQSLKKWGISLLINKLTSVKFTNTKFEGLTETIICGNKVGIIIYLDKPYGFLIKEKKAAESYKEFFDVLWKQAKK